MCALVQISGRVNKNMALLSFPDVQYHLRPGGTDKNFWLIPHHAKHHPNPADGATGRSHAGKAFVRANGAVSNPLQIPHRKTAHESRELCYTKVSETGGEILPPASNTSLAVQWVAGLFRNRPG